MSRASVIARIESDDNRINQLDPDVMLKEVLDLVHPDVDISVGDEAANAIPVTIQLKDANGDAILESRVFEMSLSDTAGGADTSGAPDVGTTASTGTVLASITANIRLIVKTDALGKAIISIGDATGTPTFYLNVFQNGEIFSSEAITFA